MASSMRVEALRHREPINLSCVLPYCILIGFGAAIRGNLNLGSKSLRTTRISRMNSCRKAPDDRCTPGVLRLVKTSRSDVRTLIFARNKLSTHDCSQTFASPHRATEL